jgi:hypothetical protein
MMSLDAVYSDFLQLAAFEPVKPRLHRHMSESLLPATETAFVVHEMHVAFDVAAVVVENLLIAQSVQTTAPAWHALHGRPSWAATCE